MENRSVKILAVDDNKDNRTKLKSLIIKVFPGAIVFLASSGQKGIEAAVKEEPDVILLDIIMPEMDGCEVCRKLKADKILCEIPVIFITANISNKDNRIKALECGADAFLTKPIDENELADKVRAMLKIREANLEKLYENIRLRKISQENAYRFQSMFDHMSSGAAIYKVLNSGSSGKDYIVVDFNKSALQIEGKEKKDVLGKSLHDLRPNIDDYGLIPVFQKVWQTGTPGFFPTKVYIDEKYNSWYENRIFKLPSGEIAAIYDDVTDRMQIQEKLRTSEEKHRRLYETMAQGVVYQAADGSIISANPAAERILGISLDQMQGRTSMDPNWKAIREDGTELPGSEHPAMIALRTGRPFGPFIMAIFQPQINDHIWLSITATPLYQPGETTPFQVYTTFQDITAERKANQNYQLLFREMANAFALHEIICDDQGKPVDYRFLAVNPAFERMTGLKPADVLGRTVMEVIPETESFWIEIYGKVALTGEPIIFSNFSSALNKHFEISAYRPAPNQFAVTFSDITEQKLANQKAEESLSRLKALLDNSPGLVVVVDEYKRLIEVSAGAAKLMGLPREEIYMKEISRIAPQAIANKLLNLLPQSLDEDQFFEKIDVIEFEGNRRYFESRVFPIYESNHGEKLYGYLGIDVTDRIVAELALKENEEKYSGYIENAPFGVFVINGDGQCVEVNASASTITGYCQDQLVAMAINDLIADESLESAAQHFDTLKNTGFVHAELKFVHGNGSIRWWNIEAVKLSENRFLGFLSDITEKKDAEANLVYLVNQDPLTELYNRRFYEAELKRIDNQSQMPLSLIIGDINGLKLVNDSFGTLEGDKIIIETAKILSKCCREGDILARTGGDEFSILLPKTSLQAAIARMKVIQAAFEQYNKMTKSEAYHINLSLGAETKESVDIDFIDVRSSAENYMNQRKLLEKNSSYSAILSSIKATMLEKSQETEAHAERIAHLSKKVGMLLKLSQIELDQIELLATLHDIGKVGVPEHILRKPGKLDENEWVEMKKHPEIGYRIAMSSPNLAPIANFILYHHERWDGNGYPQKLNGTDIPLISRIIAVADAYDAMTEDRVYRKAMTHEEAIEEIKRCAGSQFDPDIVDVFVNKVVPSLVRSHKI